jgi:hypothetical protein
MSALSIQVPFPVFQDRDGQPLDNGYVWLGVANLQPQTNPLVAYFDEALTIIAAQPLRTINGYISNAGTPAQVFVDAVNFSILVQDSKGSMVYNFPDGTGISPSLNACDVPYDPPFPGGVTYPVCEKLAQTVSAMDFGAVGDGVTPNDTAFANAIAYLESVNGGVINVPPGVFLFNDTITINSSDIVIRGSGSGWFAVTQAANKAVPTTRFVFTNASEAIHFTSVAGQIPIVRGGISDIAIDSNNIATVGLRITSLRGGLFQNLFIFDSVNDQILTDCFSGTLASGYGYDTQHNLFQNISTTFSNLSTANAHSLRLTGGQGNGGAGQGNTSCNYFMNLHLRGPATRDCVLLEDTDNNYFSWIRANGGGIEVPITTGAFVFGSSDQDSGPLNSYARFNQVHGLIAVGGLWARSGQTGGASSQNNVVFGYSRSDGADAPYYETAAGGSIDATMTVYDTNGVAWRADDFRLRKNATLNFSLTSDSITDPRVVAFSQLSVYEYGNLAAGTVTIEGTTSAGTGTYSVATGTYTRIGRLVFVQLTITWTAHTGTGDIRITGLPFTVLNASNRLVGLNVIASNLAYTAGNYLVAGTESNTKSMLLYQVSAAAAFSGVPIDAAATLYISGTYQVD